MGVLSLYVILSPESALGSPEPGLGVQNLDIKPVVQTWSPELETAVLNWSRNVKLESGSEV